MSSRNIRLLLSYDGTEFNGWQVQAAGRTVQGVMEDALHRMHKKKVNLTGAGRTDSGVHARGQVANFFSDLDSLHPEEYATALNSFLPRDVRVQESREVPKDFHARFSAKRRTYKYYIIPGASVYPWEHRYCLPLFRNPDIKLLMAMAERFLGVHDFTAFCREDKKQKSVDRHIHCSSFFIEGGYLVYQIAGNAFLWKMVRSIIGTILDFERTGKTPDDITAVLNSRKRNRAGITAPAYPLFLHHIDYGE